MIVISSMIYLEKFKELVSAEDMSRSLQLWEEYCMGDDVDGEECLAILEVLNNSNLATFFGPYAEGALALWKQVKEVSQADRILQSILDLQTSNSSLLKNMATEYLKRHYDHDPDGVAKLRIVGLYGNDFQGCISNFILLTHMQTQRFVFHSGGWGVGEVMEFSLIGEHVKIEFEGVNQPKEISFKNAFKLLKPLDAQHFLAQRFWHGEELENRAKKDPLFLIFLILRDLGPLTLQELKDEVVDSVIPQKDWSRWWQTARLKMRKEPLIAFPETAKEKIFLRQEGKSPEQELMLSIQHIRTSKEFVQKVIQFSKMGGKFLPELEREILSRIHEYRHQYQHATHVEEYAILFELAALEESITGVSYHMIASVPSSITYESLVDHIEPISYKKKCLAQIKLCVKEWRAVFLRALFVVQGNALKDYLLKELLEDEEASPLLETRLLELVHNVTTFPEAFFWYFQKIALGDSALPLDTPEQRRNFLEAFFVLYHDLEERSEHKDLLKKMHHYLIAHKYLVLREIFKGAPKEFLSEIILLSTKCYSFNKHDRQIVHSLVEAADPTRRETRKKQENDVVWTTAEGLESAQKRLHHLGTVEMMENAQEVKAARALGDLRENSEYKYALEKRGHIQTEMKALADQVHHARVIAPMDVDTTQVGIGTVVTGVCGDETTRFTILGPWDADTERQIFAFQSKFVQEMLGKKIGDEVFFHGKVYTITSIQSFLSSSKA